MTLARWKNKYIFTKVYEICFVNFARKLQEWLARLIEFQTCWKDDKAIQLLPKLVQRLEKIDNMISCMVDHWVDSMLGGFVIEFAFHPFLSYSEVERRFFKGF